MIYKVTSIAQCVGGWVWLWRVGGHGLLASSPHPELFCFPTLFMQSWAQESKSQDSGIPSGAVDALCSLGFGMPLLLACSHRGLENQMLRVFSTSSPVPGHGSQASSSAALDTPRAGWGRSRGQTRQRTRVMLGKPS